MESSPSARELALRSQSDVTPDPVDGYWNAVRAYELAQGAPDPSLDPTLAGEAAAKAGFRLAQFNPESTGIALWFDASYQALTTSDPEQKALFRRERIATSLLDGRSFALTALSAQTPEERLRREQRATHAFLNAEASARILRSPHAILRDPYETMLSRHRATHEAIRQKGSAMTAAGIALSGIGRAFLSTPEDANKPTQSILETATDHARFVGKQAAANALSLLLAGTKPLDKVSSKLAQKRRDFASFLLG